MKELEVGGGPAGVVDGCSPAAGVDGGDVGGVEDGAANKAMITEAKAQL